MLRKPMSTSLRALLALGVAPFAAFAGTSVRPPTSLEPQTTAAEVWLSYASSRVRVCEVEVGRGRAACRALIDAEASTTRVQIRPLPEASLDARHDKRTALEISARSGALPVKVGTLAPGNWEVDWPGYEKRPAFRAAAGDSVRVMLEAVSGRCELKPNGACSLVREAVRRRLDLDVQ